MYRTPPQEEDSHQPELSYPQRRREAAALRRRQKHFYSDEHPEVPKVRRASLNSDTPSAIPATTRKYVRRKQAEQEEVAPETEPVEAQHVSPTTHKIMVAQRRRPAVYEPPSTSYRRAPLRKRRRRHHPLLQAVNGNRTVAVRATIAFLAALIILPVAFNLIQNAAHGPQLLSIVTAGSNDGQPQTQPTADPHQIVLAPPNSNHPARQSLRQPRT